MSHISDRADAFVAKLMKKHTPEPVPEEQTPRQKIHQRLKNARQRMFDQRKRM